MTKYNVGDKVRYLGGDGDAWNDLTIRKLYEVVTLGEYGEAFILDDTNDYWEISAEERNAHYYELVTEPSYEQHIEYEGVEYRKVKRKAEIGDLITYSYNGEHSDYPRKVTEVTSESAYFEPYEGDDDDDNTSTVAYGHEAYDVLEPVEYEETPVEASPTVIELLANISRRLYEAEQTIKEQAYEINELYREVADRG